VRIGYRAGAAAMIAFDRPGGTSRRSPDRNVLGGELIACSRQPLTGFFRDGCCHTGPDDAGVHTVCALMTGDFLEFTVEAGNFPDEPHIPSGNWTQAESKQ